jgi:hypothetical protein
MIRQDCTNGGLWFQLTMSSIDSAEAWGGERPMGQASGFELRHPWLLHNGLLLASLLTYGIDRKDVVWRFIEAAPHVRLLEHLSFGAAAVLIALAMWLSSRAAFRDLDSSGNGSTRSRRLGGVLYALALGTLFPLPGFLFFVLGEFVRISRFESAGSPRGESPRHLVEGRKPMPPDSGQVPGFPWKSVIFPQVAACCAFLSMAVFSITLADRVAEYLFAATALVSVLAHFLTPSKKVEADTLRTPSTR